MSVLIRLYPGWVIYFLVWFAVVIGMKRELNVICFYVRTGVHGFFVCFSSGKGYQWKSSEKCQMWSVQQQKPCFVCIKHQRRQVNDPYVNCDLSSLEHLNAVNLTASVVLLNKSPPRWQHAVSKELQFFLKMSCENFWVCLSSNSYTEHKVMRWKRNMMQNDKKSKCAFKALYLNHLTVGFAYLMAKLSIHFQIVFQVWEMYVYLH